jgi:hypothetical protein
LSCTTSGIHVFFSSFSNCFALSYLYIRSGGNEWRSNYIGTTSSVLFKRILMEEDVVIDMAPFFYFRRITLNYVLSAVFKMECQLNFVPVNIRDDESLY